MSQSGRRRAWPWLCSAVAAGFLQFGCGLKGPPQPPLSKAPEPVRGLEIRQVGASIELRWYPPARRQNGALLVDDLGYQILARAVERAALPAAGRTASNAATNPSLSGAGGSPTGVLPAVQSPAAGGNPAGLPGIAGRAHGPDTQRLDEDVFLKSAGVVVTIRGEPPELAEKTGGKVIAASKPITATIGPADLPGLRLEAARLVLAVVAVDAKGRRSPPRPIVEIDPVAPLAPPRELTAVGETGGVRLGWKLPFLDDAQGPVGVDLYRGPKDEGSPPVLIAGAPFAGEGAVDGSATLGNAYVYEARLVALAQGKGLRESPPSARATVEYLDTFPPGPPSLVTVELLDVGAERPGERRARIAWSGPIDRDVAGYRIERAEGDGVFTTVTTVPLAQSRWTDDAVTPGRRYRYRVIALDGANPPNASEPSDAVETAIPASPVKEAR